VYASAKRKAITLAVGASLRPLIVSLIHGKHSIKGVGTSARRGLAFSLLLAFAASPISAGAAPIKVLVPPRMFPPGFVSLDVGADLKVCGIGASCSGDMGSLNWMTSATVNLKDTKRGLRWSTKQSAVTGGLLQISRIPFSGPASRAAFYTRNVPVGTIVMDFDILFGSPPETLPIGRRLLTGAHLATLPSSASGGQSGPPRALTQFRQPMALAWDNVYRIRVLPLIGSKVAGLPTNEITVRIVKPADQSFQFYEPPKIYEVKIKDFTPLLAPDKGVCPHRMILDTDWLMPTGVVFKKAGAPICPAPYKGMGEKAWYEQLWDALSSGLSWASQAYANLKSSLVNAVGSIACAGNGDCKSLLSAGLDIGLAAMGMPPDIPNFDQLVDGGFDYLAGEISDQAGCPDVVCKDAVTQGLKKALAQQKNTNPICDATRAHEQGVEPLCLPNGVTAHLDPAATYRDAKAVLEIRRNQLDGNAGRYKLFLTAWATNANSVGGTITNIEPYGKSLKIDKPLAGWLFQSKIISIPPLDKGQTIEVPINLAAEEYWVPGHKELMGGWSTVTFHDGWPQYQYDDWWMLYYGGTMTMTATIDGCQYSGGSGCAVSSDAQTVTLPMTLNP
jgi:hypothetical protein